MLGILLPLPLPGNNLREPITMTEESKEIPKHKNLSLFKKIYLLLIFLVYLLGCQNISQEKTVQAQATLSNEKLSIPNFPKKYTGHFYWRSDFEKQYIEYELSNFSINDDGNIIAKGKGISKAGNEIVHFDINMEIHPKNLNIEIWESNSDNPEIFATNGSYKGKISRDYKEINAVWKTIGENEFGDLNLKSSSTP